MRKKINVFCADIGYSLKKDLQIWENDNCSYEGHIIYGVDQDWECGIEVNDSAEMADAIKRLMQDQVYSEKIRNNISAKKKKLICVIAVKYCAK